ncbi:MAG: hypothetical protein R2698_09395 [Microthrixaceae bacterium]
MAERDRHALILSRRRGSDTRTLGRVAPVFTLAKVEELAMSFPGVTEGRRWGNTTWSVDGKAFVWERPFTKADIRRFGDSPLRSGDIVAVATDGLDEKAAVLQSGVQGVFTIAHFDGYAAVLVQLSVVPAAAMRDLLLDAWLACAKPVRATEYLARRQIG